MLIIIVLTCFWRLLSPRRIILIDMRLSLIISVRWLKPTLSLLKWTIPLGSYMLRTLSPVDVINIAVFSHCFCAMNIRSYHVQYKSRIGRNKFSKLTVLQRRLLKKRGLRAEFCKAYTIIPQKVLLKWKSSS